jgi:crotonobetainyl-CoA:carnitine CoA-transferase CaiB-like acyl-CoA transferase
MKPLEGTLVIELSTYKAAAGCGRVLASQGARVIKVESPKGDIERKFGATLHEPVTEDENPNYDFLNAGKEDIVLNLKDPADMQRMYKLLEKADVFISNNRPQALEKMGLGYDQVKERFPQLVYAMILGYGEKGPMKDMPGFDAIAMFAYPGLLTDMMIDTPTSYPCYLPMAFGDLIIGTALAGAIGTCLYGRTKTGKGDYVSISLYGAAMWMYGVMSTGTQYGYKWPRGRYEGSPMGVPFKTKDGKWFLPCINEYERYWKQYCEILDAEEIVDDPRFCTKEATFDPDNRKAAVQYFEKKYLQKTAKEIEEGFAKHDMIGCTMGKLKDGHSSEQALANGYMSPFTYESGKQVTMPQPPFEFGSFEKSKAERAHSLGQDNEKIFKEFGL